MAERSDYEEIEVFREPDGIVAVVTQKTGTTYLSYSLMKEYERDGALVRTSFLNRRHIASVRRLLLRVEEYLDAAADRAVASTRKRRITEKQ